ncbi:hypothetical protein A2841_00405 [Candidatus Kaiserbacteria bacterium RIFCSPHIGHO2_01_FULL_48_10]|uniref:DUF4234 domain-containing protein n=1 Tax=Candidatus Kaiserbacteria bacterium RIFCSPHIGHO2_01_FULL_48_10 TaxID=1798476 RepID=A0A1F6C4Y1_9BACT|nr:MAG: hypothetical protein A2841_00405 [Candidatus Kaiserbacteria bacterium RIFCSPHIGHO2_01_FULL_48_10]
MSVATFGIYDIYWFYKNFRAIKEADKSTILPFWRAIFVIIFCYGLFCRITASAIQRGFDKKISAGSLAVLYIVFNFIGQVSSRGDDGNFIFDILFLISFLSIFPLIEIQKAINYNNVHMDNSYEPLDTFSGLEIFFVLLGGILWALYFLGIVLGFLLIP